MSKLTEKKKNKGETISEAKSSYFCRKCWIEESLETVRFSQVVEDHQNFTLGHRFPPWKMLYPQ